MVTNPLSRNDSARQGVRGQAASFACSRIQREIKVHTVVVYSFPFRRARGELFLRDSAGNKLFIKRIDEQRRSRRRSKAKRRLRARSRHFFFSLSLHIRSSHKAPEHHFVQTVSLILVTNDHRTFSYFFFGLQPGE